MRSRIELYDVTAEREGRQRTMRRVELRDDGIYKEVVKRKMQTAA
jgi:hypothetical protein